MDQSLQRRAAKVWTVAEVTAMVKGLLEETFYPVWVEGEVRNLTIHRSGHVYFTLKDPRSQLTAVFFSGAGYARKLGLKEGMAIEAHGRLTVYEARGAYQLSVQQIRPKGIGRLQVEFERLKETLRQEGLFESERKQAIPVLPKCVGIVTSPDGAAIRDFLQVLGRRYANMHIRIYPAAVQGAGAGVDVANGIRYFNSRRSCDVIVVTRGGGSIEDLWAFNEEIVARAIAASTIPVISAVGHEVDFTIADFVADLRVPTPSAAAELVVGHKSELMEQVARLEKQMLSSLKLQLSTLQRRVERVTHHYVFREPLNVLRQFQQRVDELNSRLGQSMARKLDAQNAHVEQLQRRLHLLDPNHTLARGYAIVMDEQDRVQTDAQQIIDGQPLQILLADGRINVIAQKQSEGDTK